MRPLATARQSLGFVLLLLLAGGFAQDIEPSRQSARERLLACVEAEVLRRGEAVKAISIEAAAPAHRAEASALRFAVQAAGFEVATRPGPGVFAVALKILAKEPPHVVLLAAGEEAPFADVRVDPAPWLSNPGPDRLLVSSPFGHDLGEAKDLARRAAQLEVRRRLGLDCDPELLAAPLEGSGPECFIQYRGFGAARVLRVHMGYAFGAAEQGAILAKVSLHQQLERKELLLKLALIGVLLLLMLLAYWKLDLLTRGYCTLRLRLLALCATGLIVFGVWQSPLP